MALPRSPQYRMADHLAGGRLLEVLTEKAEAGLPWEVVSKQLFVDFHIDVTGQTLRRWAVILGLATAHRSPAPAPAPVAQEAS
jgi:hypothetical protein